MKYRENSKRRVSQQKILQSHFPIYLRYYSHEIINAAKDISLELNLQYLTNMYDALASLKDDLSGWRRERTTHRLNICDVR